MNGVLWFTCGPRTEESSSFTFFSPSHIVDDTIDHVWLVEAKIDEKWLNFLKYYS